MPFFDRFHLGRTLLGTLTGDGRHATSATMIRLLSGGGAPAFHHGGAATFFAVHEASPGVSRSFFRISRHVTTTGM